MSTTVTIENTDHQKIISILSTEIGKDGGACLVRDLKEYNSSIRALLRRCSNCKNTSARRGMKLASFMELYPDIFEVHRESEPHLVYLISNKCSNACDVNCDNTIIVEKKQLLIEKIVYRILVETNKDFRRNNNKAPGASISWLLKQCQYPFHAYLRLLGYYHRTYSNCREVQFIGSKGWFNIVLDEFIGFIVKEKVGTVLTNDAGYEQRLILRKEESPNDSSSIRPNNIGKIDVNILATALAKKVEEDGGTHITLGLLLHRDGGTIRNLLRGQDLIKLTQEHPECFENMINIYQKNYEIVLQSTSPKNTGRLLVDQTGLFSVTSSKWANALITILIRQCQKRLCTSLKEESPILFSPKEHVLAIDLTASVGGMTLSLAKTFNKVIAYEIDTVRANLCRQNMHDYNAAVDIRNQDSIEMLPHLARELSLSDSTILFQQTVVIMDPPWGGMHYKNDERNGSNTPIMMGKWTLVEAVKRVHDNLTPTILALRMPVSFDANGFLSQLKDKNIGGVIVESHVVKKVGPQLFITLTM